MFPCVFIGDEVSAAGFRLAGVAVQVPTPAEAPALFERLCGEAQLILVTAEVADWLGAERLGRRVRDDRPLVLVLADIRNRHVPPDLAQPIRRQLGIAL